MDDEVPVDVRWTRSCYCGQEVEPGRRVGSEPVWGLPFAGGSEDGASIFHEPLATEGRRLPAELADPVHGRKIQAAPTTALPLHETNPEFQAIRIGDRLLLGAPGEPSVEMGKRFVRAVEPVLPAGSATRSPSASRTTTSATSPRPRSTTCSTTRAATPSSALDLAARAEHVRRADPGDGGRPAGAGALGATGPRRNRCGQAQRGNGGVEGRLVEGPAGRCRG